jgi:hypothetical protein
MKILDWKARIDRQFEAGLFDKVVINSSQTTKEITNFEYCLVPENIDNVDMVAPPDEEEWREREYIVERSKEMFEANLSLDINSRRAAFVNDYDGADNHCISYFHHYVRNTKYSMNVYVRSMNYTANFIFDCQTFNLAYREVFNRLKIKYRELVDQGFIRVFVFSLHKYEI